MDNRSIHTSQRLSQLWGAITWKWSLFRLIQLKSSRLSTSVYLTSSRRNAISEVIRQW
jgi:hypothetical protein